VWRCQWAGCPHSGTIHIKRGEAMPFAALCTSHAEIFRGLLVNHTPPLREPKRVSIGA
jgi:hypothetical protein